MRLKPRIFRKPQLTHPLARGLVGYWLHNEGSGLITNDLSGNGNYGTITGATWAGDKLSFDGVGDRIEIPNSAGFSATNSITVIATIMRTSDDYTVHRGIVAGDTFPSSFILKINQTTGFLNWFVDTSTGNMEIINAAIPLNTKITIAVTYDGVKGEMYRNGVSDNMPDTQAGTIDQYAVDVQIGAWRTASNEFFIGHIYDVKIYNRALSAGEILRLFRDPYILFRQDPAWIGQAGVAAPSPGQVIFITKAEKETDIKAVLPVMWACQGSNDRRNFLKYTGLAVIGL